MLAHFCVQRRFNKLHVGLHVHCSLCEASMMIIYDRIIIRSNEIVPYHLVDTPEKAEAYLGQPTGEYGNFIERLEWQCRHGQLQPLPRTQDDAPAEAAA